MTVKVMLLMFFIENENIFTLNILIFCYLSFYNCVAIFYNFKIFFKILKDEGVGVGVNSFHILAGTPAEKVGKKRDYENIEEKLECKPT